MKAVLALIVIVLVLAVVLICGYCAFLLFSYARIGDRSLEPENRTAPSLVKTGVRYTVSTYNVGFGAYQQDYTCVMDSCYVPTDDGGWEKVKGKHLKALSRDDALRNTQGAAAAIAALDPDFAFFQEIDRRSDRCYGIDQTAVVRDALGAANTVFCPNFDTPFLAYPLHDMMGSAESGLLTVSRCSITAAQRYEFEVTSHKLHRLFDLDRCFCASFTDVENGRQLVLVNVHMSAYDKGGVIRARQRRQLYSFIREQYTQGNYVVVGGDFNHDLLTNNPAYPEYTREHIAFSGRFRQKRPDSIVFFFDDDGDAGLPDGFRVFAGDNAPTCRPAGIPWQPGFSYIRTLDGFIVSDNVKVECVENVVTATDRLSGFAYSDHEPAFMRFTLKP